MRRLYLAVALASAALAVAACHHEGEAVTPSPPTDTSAVVVNVPVESNGDDVNDGGYVCPRGMSPMKCDTLGGHYASPVAP